MTNSCVENNGLASKKAARIVDDHFLVQLDKRFKEYLPQAARPKMNSLCIKCSKVFDCFHIKSHQRYCRENKKSDAKETPTIRKSVRRSKRLMNKRSALTSNDNNHKLPFELLKL